MIKRPRIFATVKMGRSDSFGRIAPVINHQQRQVAAMASGAERPLMFFSVGRIVVASGSKARGQVCLDSSQARSHLFREYETRAPRAAAQKSLGVITKPVALSVKITVPKVAPTPVALIELIVAVAVAAAAGLPAKRKLATNRLKIAFKESRMLLLLPLHVRSGSNQEFRM